MEFRILGRVEVLSGGRKVDLGPAESTKARGVLAVLLRTPGTPVAAEALCCRVWDDPPPGPSSRYKYVGWLRAALAPYGVTLACTSEGYILHVDPGQVDLHRFRRLVSEARRVLEGGDPGRASGMLDEAVGLWRGPALAGLSSSWADLFREQLERERRAAVVLRAYVDLDGGRSGELLDQLAELECENPTDETIIGLRMLALHRHGRRVEALDCYGQATGRIRAAMAAEPGPDLQQLARRIRAGDPALDVGPATGGGPPPAAATPVTTPRQLPAVPGQFAGRAAELAALTSAAAEVGRAAGALVVMAIDGTAGIGKTTLAVYWAHQVADRFPDGQLYVDLHGFDPSRSPVTAAEAIAGFLAAFAVPAQHLPPSPEAQAGLYRSLLANRRMLILLDNACDADQVRPLLPGSAGCMVIVTSRNQLSGVLASGARALTLDLLTPAEARELLTRLLGAGRVDSQPRAADELIELCARLPLALSIAAGQATARPTFPLSTLVADVRDAGGRLDALDGGDAATDLRAVFSWSYRRLGPAAARLFRLLGLHPGPEITVGATADLAGVPAGRARAALIELARAHLVVERTPGRYTFHDLLRVYAAELADRLEPAADRDAARRRMLDHYLYTGYAAALRLHPHRVRIDMLPAPAHAVPEDPRTAEAAIAWFTVERPVLLAAQRLGADHGFDHHVWHLAWAMANFLERQGHWQDYADTHTAALAAARRLADRPGQAYAHRGLARAQGRLGHHDEAYAHLRQALELYAEFADPAGQAGTHLSLGVVFEPLRRYREGLLHARRALSLYREAGDPAGQAQALSTIGWCHALLGDDQSALDYCRRALAVHRRIGDRHAEAMTWDTIGYVNHRRGHHRRAFGYYHRALALHREAGDRYSETVTLGHLGDAYRAVDDLAAAQDAWSRGLAILEEQQHPDAAEFRLKIAMSRHESVAEPAAEVVMGATAPALTPHGPAIAPSTLAVP